MEQASRRGYCTRLRLWRSVTGAHKASFRVCFCAACDARYMTGDTHTRNHMLKLIPHIADGSWMIKQSVGTTPVILGKQLRTIYYETEQVSAPKSRTGRETQTS